MEPALLDMGTVSEVLKGYDRHVQDNPCRHPSRAGARPGGSGGVKTLRYRRLPQPVVGL